MTVTRPYRRTCRPFIDGSYATSGRSAYIRHSRFATAPRQYIRAFLLLQQDLQKLFEYIEPADTNLPAYSYRTHELLLRSCVEVEANCKAILLENGYDKSGDLRISDYKKLNSTHRLSEYEVIAPVWQGDKGRRKPFAAWSLGDSTTWYDAYNATKHDRHTEFQRATFECAVDALMGLLVLLSSQFHTNDFAPQDFLVTESADDVGIGGYFFVRFPSFHPDERYDFEWHLLSKEPDPFASLFM